jgi:hypothetical protein
MEQEIFTLIKNGVLEWLTNYVDWPFTGFFIVVTYVFNFFTDRKSPTTKHGKFFQKVPKSVRVFIFGIITGIVWIIFFSQISVLKTKDVGQVLGGILAGMIAHKIGTNILSNKKNTKN